MIRSILCVPVLGLVALLCAAPARAGCPYQANYIVPTYLDVYACRNGDADPLENDVFHQNRVILRDLANFPLAGAEVTVTFCPDVKINHEICGHPEMMLLCGSPLTVRTLTDADGIADLWLVGATINTNGTAAGTGANCATITVPVPGSPCLFQSYPATVVVYDQNGAVGLRGVEGGDIAAWLGDFGKKAVIGYKGRSDYSHNGSIEGGDFARLLKVFGLGNSRDGGGPLCP